MSDSDLFLSDSDNDMDYNVENDYKLKVGRREDLSSSEDEAYKEMGIDVRRKKRARLCTESPVAGTSSHMNGTFFDNFNRNYYSFER